MKGHGLGVTGCEEKEVENGQRWESCNTDKRLERQIKEKIYNYHSTAKIVLSHPDTEQLTVSQLGDLSVYKILGTKDPW